MPALAIVAIVAASVVVYLTGFLGTVILMAKVERSVDGPTYIISAVWPALWIAVGIVTGAMWLNDHINGRLTRWIEKKAGL